MPRSTGPACTTLPPCSPEPGPSSSMKSACWMAARSCSTTTTVLPASRSRCSSASSRSVSLGVEPDGRLVQHVQRIHQVRAQGVGRAKSAGPRRPRECGSAGRGSDSPAHVSEEGQPGIELIDDELGHRPVPGGQWQRLQPVVDGVHGPASPPTPMAALPMRTDKASGLSRVPPHSVQVLAS